jgi:threonine aldolase
MFFASDNGAGASPKVIRAVADAFQSGPAIAYGDDDLTRAVERRFCELFEREVAVFLLASGTATNALALAHVTPPWGAIYAHEVSHAHATECGATEFYVGAKFVPVAGPGGKVTPEALAAKVRRANRGNPHSVQPATVTITNLTECGTLYRAEEIAALSEICRREGMRLHLDGARFANAVAATGASPAEMTWRAGVDVMSFGATKNGAITAEAVVFFDPALADGFIYRRMRGGHLLSKMRFVSAQFEAWLEAEHWLDLARHSNAMAARLASGLQGLGYRLAWPAEGNEVFPILPAAVAQALRARGLRFHGGNPDALAEPLRPGETIARLIPSFATTPEEVDELLALLTEIGRPAQAAE